MIRAHDRLPHTESKPGCPPVNSRPEIALPASNPLMV